MSVTLGSTLLILGLSLVKTLVLDVIVVVVVVGIKGAVDLVVVGEVCTEIN